MRCSFYACRVKICIFFVILVGMGTLHSLEEAFSDTLTERQKQDIRQEIQNTIRRAHELGQDGNYIEAFRLLFDAAYTERDTRLRLALEIGDGDQFPLTTDAEITQLEAHLFHNDPSPLLQYFRDPDVLIQEKVEHIAELRIFAATQRFGDEDLPFWEKYPNEALMQLIASRTLSFSEKLEILSELEFVVQTYYISNAQKHNLKEDIIRLQQEAEQKFHAQHYVEAFLLLATAEQKADSIQLSGDEGTSLNRYSVQLRKAFVHADESSLMLFFQNRQIPLKRRQALLYALRGNISSLSGTDFMTFDGETYDGALVQILRTPDLHWGIKDRILVSIEVEILKKEPDYRPEWMRGDDKEFLELWEGYVNELQKGGKN